MDGGLDHYTRAELFDLLAVANAELAEHHAAGLASAETVHAMNDVELRQVVVGTLGRLAHLLRMIGEQ